MSEELDCEEVCLEEKECRVLEAAKQHLPNCKDSNAEAVSYLIRYYAIHCMGWKEEDYDAAD